MLTQKQNQTITNTDSGTPAGNYLRSYWLPVALPAQLEQRNPMPLIVMGEKLALFRAGDGRLGLLADRCAHRGTSLSAGSEDVKTAGRIDPRGLRCCYHGWLYAPDGQCLDQPGEPPGSRFCEKVKIGSHRVEERYGFIWAYMGSGEPPAIPPIDALVRNDGYNLRTIGKWPCNYFQVLENLVDPIHVSSLHLETAFDERFEAMPTLRVTATDLGLKTIAGRPGYERAVEFMMPSAVRLGLPIVKSGVQLAFWVVPVDNSTCQTFHAWFLPRVEGTADDEHEQSVKRLRSFVYELDDRDPIYSTSKVSAQDKFACASQGIVSDRSVEHLGASDAGVILLRKLFFQGIKAVEEGGIPKGALPIDSEQDVVAFPHVF